MLSPLLIYEHSLTRGAHKEAHKTMAYDSRTDRANFYGPRFETDTPWHYRQKTANNKALKRQTNKKLRRMPLTRQHEMFGKRVYCYCCCTALC